MYVGVRSGGKVRVPTGVVQIRVDDNEAWTIDPSETPMPLLSKENGAASTPASTAVALSIARATSPFTAVSGEKAKSILRQMLAGKNIKYRKLALGDNNSTTGETPVDASLPAALLSIGIDPAKL